MRTVRRLLTAESWAHAGVELLLIVLGILIALWINDWHDARKSRKTELSFLREMRGYLVLDTAQLATSLGKFAQHQAGMDSVLKVIEENRPESPHVDSLLGRSYWIAATPIVQRGIYDVLKSRGFDLITNDSLRQRVTQLYGNDYDRVAIANDQNTNTVYTVMRPYFLQNFTVLAASSHAHPSDYTRTMHDPYFRNIIRYRRGSTNTNVLAFSRALADARQLIRAIDKELDAG